MENNIFGAVFSHAKQERLSFHMPGHKGKTPVNFPCNDIFKLDITEISGMDNLYNPQGIIKKSQDTAAEIYGAKRSHFLTGGSTAGVVAAFLSCVKDGDKALIARNCHRSVITGLILTGAVPVYISPEITDSGLAGGIDPQTVRTALQQHGDIRAVVITSPTYEGFTSNIDEIAQITKNAGAYLIIDAAHGAHFPFSADFPNHPQSADIVVSGLHKTLPVFGQCGLLNIYNEELADKAAAALALSQTSSPSYLFLSSIDLFFQNYLNGFYHFDEYAQRLRSTRQRLGKLKRVKLLGRESAECFAIDDVDISRLTFLFDDGKPETGRPSDFARVLRENYAIDIEAFFTRHAIAISSVADSGDDLDALAFAVEETDRDWEGICGAEQNNSEYKVAAENRTREAHETPVVSETRETPATPVLPETRETPVFETLNPQNITPEMVYTPRKAWYMRGEYVPLSICAGRVAAETVLLYPPGIATLCPGELIDDRTAVFLSDCVKQNRAVHGLKGSEIRVVSPK